uniref:Restriction endonuclease type IV Mrr domain-containing protein n=1 Tax=viral metagenome TaxID=1070528 RepID=A0A6M3LA39_9ZZZZ
MGYYQYSPVEPTIGIKYPRKRSEAEIQALLWYFLRKKKIDARLEVRGGSPDGKRGCQLDIVVFVDKSPVCIIECKSWSSSYQLTARYRVNNRKQIQRYKEFFGLPVLVCGRINKVTDTVREVESILSSTNNPT